MKRPVIAANWKLHKNPVETQEFFNALLEELPEEGREQFLFFPPVINLMTTQAILEDTGVRWGAQNVYWENSGAFTGENSAQTVKELGGTHVLIGHSERRQMFGETDEHVSKKVAHVQALGMVPVVCVGETLEQRENDQTEKVITQQLDSVLKVADKTAPILIAYEPVWAIGTGKTATPEMANEAHQILRNQIAKTWGEGPAKETSILYGGSVKPENAKDLSAQAQLDGFLIGGASLKVDALLQIHQATNNYS